MARAEHPQLSRLLLASTLLALGLSGCLTSSEDYQDMLAYASDQDGDGYAPRDGDCDDFNAGVHPGLVDVWYDGVDTDCDGWDDDDADRDGAPVPEDCDDADPSSYPGGVEECDGVDEDCDGQVDEGMSRVWYEDRDGDGQGSEIVIATTCLAPAGFIAEGGDCDDTDPLVYSGAEEICDDGVVNDCVEYKGECRLEGVLVLDPSEPEVLRWTGDADAENLGSWVAFGGDVDNDGLSDLLVGAALVSSQDPRQGAAYLLLGRDLVSGELPAQAYATYLGVEEGARLGRGVEFSKDLNSDGRDELILVAAGDADTEAVVYIVMSATAGTHDVSSAAHTTLVADDSFAEFAVVGAGNTYNGYGAALAVGDGSANSFDGAVYLWRVSTAGTRDLEASAYATITGDVANGQAGSSLAGEADLDGDGVDDLVIGAPRSDSDQGRVYVLLGPVSGSVSLADAHSTLTGTSGADLAGWSVSAGGDVDGDGLADFAVGGPGAEVAGQVAGRAWMMTSAPSGEHTLDVAELRVDGDFGGAELGTSLTLTSDIDGQGTSDLAVSAPRTEGRMGGEAGAVFVWYSPEGPSLTPSDADLRLEGESEADRIGSRLQGGGNANGDLGDDIVFSSVSYGTESYRPGAAYLLLGSNP